MELHLVVERAGGKGSAAIWQFEARAGWCLGNRIPIRRNLCSR